MSTTDHLEIIRSVRFEMENLDRIIALCNVQSKGTEIHACPTKSEIIALALETPEGREHIARGISGFKIQKSSGTSGYCRTNSSGPH